MWRSVTFVTGTLALTPNTTATLAISCTAIPRRVSSSTTRPWLAKAMSIVPSARAWRRAAVPNPLPISTVTLGYCS